VAQYNPYAPDDLVAVVRKCLAKDPDDRFTRAGDLEAALTACRCAGLWTEDRAADWWAAHPEDVPEDGTDLNSLPYQDPTE
jgi:serine/threonine protein kinase